VVGLLLLAGIWLLPDLMPRQNLPIEGETRTHARVLDQPHPDEQTGQTMARVELLDGPRAGQVIEAVIEGGTPGGDVTTLPSDYAVGDEVIISQFAGPSGEFSTVSDRWRLPVLGVLLLLFAAVVIIVGGWKGISSLIGLALTLAVVVKLVIPLLLRGWDPVPLAAALATGLTVVTLLLTEGPRRATLAAMIGTGLALVLTAVLAAAFTALARFSALQGSEDVAFLIPVLGASFNPSGLLLAGTIFGALGVLDDVTLTQAAAVDQLRLADSTAPRGHVFGRAMEVGRSHIAATVNTLVLAYLGASLPLLLLFAVGGPAPLLIINGEILAVEIVRTLVGSIGIVAAVPLTTAVAVMLLPQRPSSEAPAMEF
jgi:uncharacterized membrane protein